MKTRIFKYIAVVALLFMAIPMQGQNYLKLWFKDGHTERHFMHLVKSISATKYDLEGNLHSDYQMQQIIMEDTTYSYYIADIDSMSFKKVDEEKISADIKSTITAIEPILEQSSSVEEMATHFDDIKNMESVDSVWTVGSDVIVQIRDWRKIFYHFHDFNNDNINRINKRKDLANSLARKSYAIPSNNKRIAVAVQMINDTKFEDDIKENRSICKGFKNLGFDADFVTDTKPLDYDFFINDLYTYDIVILDTHGSFDGDKHWLMTSMEIDPNDTDSFFQKYKSYDIDEVSWSECTEYTDYECIRKWYVILPEDFKTNSFNRPNPTILFNEACQSLKGNDGQEILRNLTGITEPLPGNSSMARTFFDKGVDLYLGFNESTSVSGYTAHRFFYELLQGKSIEAALYDLTSKYPSYIIDHDKYDGDKFLYTSSFINLYTPDLDHESINSTFLVKTFTKKIPQQEIDEQFVNGNPIKISGFTTMTNLDGSEVICGIRYGEDSRLLSYSKEESSNKQIVEGNSLGNVTFSSDINLSNFKSGTKIYYRAYTFDGIHYNLGEIYSFTIPEASTPYHDLCPDGNHPHMIDLGLPSGTKWSCCNVGASVPTAYGNYYAWGETSTKSTYTKENYKYHHTDSDGKYVYDDATFTMAPTPDQVKELFANCTATETSVDGVAGEKLTSKKNGKKIFLPYGGAKGTSTVGEGEEYQYWTSQLEKSASNSKLLAPRQYSDNETDDLGNPYAFDWYEKDFRYIGKTVRKASK